MVGTLTVDPYTFNDIMITIFNTLKNVAKRSEYASNVLPKLLYDTRLNAHFEKILTSNAHNSYMITEIFTCLKNDFTRLRWVDKWLSRTLARVVNAEFLCKSLMP